MSSALMIAYWFPPEGNAAAYRPLRFARTLPRFGWTTRVITGPAEYERYDPGLVGQLPEAIEVVRVEHGDLWQRIQRQRAARFRQHHAGSTAVAAGGRGDTHVGAATEPRTSGREVVRELIRRTESAWYHPDMQRSWIRPATAAALSMCSRTRPDVVWATGPPWSAFLVARLVAARLDLPYVLDFRTSWTIVPSPFEAMRPRWAQRRDRRLLADLLAGARAVTFFYRAEAECFWRLYKHSLDVARIHVIPNGFDGDIDVSPPPATRPFRLVYTGTLSDYFYDTFLVALARLATQSPASAEMISVEFVGEEDPRLLHQVRELGLAKLVSARPPVSHAEAERLQRGAHALLMLERNPTHKGYELLAGAKLFNYLKAGRPILGVVPEGVAAGILRDVGVSTVADAASVDAISTVLDTMLEAWRSERLDSLAPDPVACQRYSASHQTAALVRALDGLTPLEPFVPGTVDVVPSLRGHIAAFSQA